MLEVRPAEGVSGAKEVVELGSGPRMEDVGSGGDGGGLVVVVVVVIWQMQGGAHHELIIIG